MGNFSIIPLTRTPRDLSEDGEKAELMSKRLVVLSALAVLACCLPLFSQTTVLGRPDRSALALVPADEPIVQLAEVGGEEDVVVRITPTDRSGDALGSGRVIVLGALEARTIRLRDEFSDLDLRATELRVEVIQGSGQLVASSLALEPRGGSTGSPRRRAVRHPGPLRSSFALIDQAEADGSLNSETALLYRVYSLFADSRLPGQYRGDDSSVTDSLYLAEARDRFATLSAATQEALQPFLTPPAYTASWANASRGDVEALALPPPCDFFSDRWASVDSANGLVRVWYRPELPDQLRAGAVAGAIDATIWPKLDGLMTGHRPITDLAENCNGGNGRLDIYLADVPNSEAIPYRACTGGPRPVFILLKRTSPDALVAHELFHAFQYAYTLSGCITDPNYRWWAEASAQWSQDFVNPADKTEQTVAPYFLNVPELQLDLRDTAHEYGAYLLPFYVYRKTGDAGFVRKSWENSATRPALEALDLALSGGFKTVWPEFARYNWNQKPVDDYKTWDGLTSSAKPAGGSVVTLGATPDSAVNLKTSLPRLSATYKHFFFDDTVTTIAFWNGVTTKLSLRERTLGGLQYENDPAGPDETKGAKVQALIKIGETWRTEDWTDREFVPFCRDLTAERISELVLIISNSEFASRDRKLESPGLAPVLFVSNMGCWRWKGTANYDDGVSTTVRATVTWTRVAGPATSPSISYEAEGNATWAVSNPACSGNGSFPLTGFNTLTSYNFITPAGSFHRSYVGAGVSEATGSITCGQSTQPISVPQWLANPLQPFTPGIPTARFLKVSSDGKTMDDFYALPGLTSGWTWHFVSQRQ